MFNVSNMFSSEYVSKSYFLVSFMINILLHLMHIFFIPGT